MNRYALDERAIVSDATSQPARHSRARGRLWAAAGLGTVICSLTAGLAIVPRRLEGPSSLAFAFAWVDQAGVLHATPAPANKGAVYIGVLIERYEARCNDELLWARVHATLTAGAQGPLNEPMLSEAVTIIENSTSQATMKYIGADGTDRPWAKVLAGQPGAWTSVEWTPVRRYAVFIVAAGFVGGAAGFGVGAALGTRQRPRDRCHACGYSRTGLAGTTVCPECGTPFDAG